MTVDRISEDGIDHGTGIAEERIGIIALDIPNDKAEMDLGKDRIVADGHTFRQIERSYPGIHLHLGHIEDLK